MSDPTRKPGSADAPEGTASRASAPKPDTKPDTKPSCRFFFAFMGSQGARAGYCTFMSNAHTAAAPRTINRLRVADAAAGVRWARRALLRPGAWNMTPERANERLAEELEVLARALRACPEHNAPIDLG